MCLDILDRLGVDHECDRWTDRQTDRQTDRTLYTIAIARFNDAR